MPIFNPSDLGGGVLSLYNNGIIPIDNAPDNVSFGSLLRSLFPPTSGGQAAPAAPPIASAAPALPPPINVPSAPQPYDLGQAALPPAARPTGPAKISPDPAALVPQAAPPELPQPGLGSQIAGGIGGIGNTLFQMFAPRTSNALYQRQLLNTQLQSLMQIPGMTPAKAIAIVSNQKLQEQVFGNPTSLGELKAGNVSIPVAAQNGKTSLVTGGNDIGDIMKLANESARSQAAATKLGEGQGTALAGLPATLASNDAAIGNIDALLKDSGLKFAVGPLGVSSYIPGSPGANARARLDQIR